jgi:hypothetical protein
MVGEISAIDWASKLGKPRALVRSPRLELPAGVANVALEALVVVMGTRFLSSGDNDVSRTAGGDAVG